jgi:flagellin
LSTSDAQKASSAIAKAAAINDSTQFHGVTATATATIANLGTVDASTFAGADTLTINGEEITGINVQADDGDGTFVDAINAIAEKTGVTASIDEDQQLIL